jgi:hypothetical protein
VKASPANARAVQETIVALQLQGHECVELNWPFGKVSIPRIPRDPALIVIGSEPVRLFGGLQGADGYRTLFRGLGSDPRVSVNTQEACVLGCQDFAGGHTIFTCRHTSITT